MCRNMILGSRMERPSWFGQAGIRIQDCSFPVRELRLAWALESASIAELVWGGPIGGFTGLTGRGFKTTTPTFPTAESLSIVTTSTRQVGNSNMHAGIKCVAPAAVEI